MTSPEPNLQTSAPRDIPEPIKRQIRQRCGFGCVLCGLPLFEYEHLKGWANVQRHMPEEITLLCDAVNRLVLRISDNELVYSVDTWDIELVGTNLLIRQAARQILTDLRFELDAGRVTMSRGRFLFNGVELLITPDYALIVNNRSQFASCSMINCQFGLVLGEMPQEFGAAVRVQGIPRYLGDRTAAKAWADANIGGL